MAEIRLSHNRQHGLTASEDHVVSGLTPGEVLTATGESCFGWAALPGAVPPTRLVSTTAPLAGGGDLSADRTLSLGCTANLKVTGGNLDTVQDLQTSSTPQFAKVKTAVIYPAADSTSAVTITKADGSTAVLTVDTTNSVVAVGTYTTPNRALNVMYAAATPGTSLYFSGLVSLQEDTSAQSAAVSGSFTSYRGGYNQTRTTSGGGMVGFITYLTATNAGTTSLVSGVYVSLTSQTGVITTATGLSVAAPSAVSGGSITNFYGLDIAAATAATNIYAIRSQVASAANRWNLYISGTAINYLAGNLLLGTLTDGMTAAGSIAIAQDLAHRGTKAGFYNTTPQTKQTVTGSRGGNAALASLLTALATVGLITDSTTA